MNAGGGALTRLTPPLRKASARENKPEAQVVGSRQCGITLSAKFVKNAWYVTAASAPPASGPSTGTQE